MVRVNAVDSKDPLLATVLAPGAAEALERFEQRQWQYLCETEVVALGREQGYAELAAPCGGAVGNVPPSGWRSVP